MDYINAPVGEGAGAGAPAAAAGRGPDHDRHRQREHHDLRARRARRCKVKTGISHPALRPRLAVVDPSLTLTQPADGHRRRRDGHPLPRAGELHRAAGTPTSTPSGPSSGCPTAAPTRSPTCGRSRRWRCWPGRSAPPSATAATPRPASRWRWPRRSPGSASATPACTSRTPTPTRSPAGCATSGPTGYPQDEPIVPHGMAVSLTAPEAFRFTFDAAPGAAPARRPAARPGAPADGPDALPACSPTLMRDIGHARTGWPRSGTARPTSTTWSPARCSSSGCWPPRPSAVTDEDLAGIIRRSMEHW